MTDKNNRIYDTDNAIQFKSELKKHISKKHKMYFLDTKYRTVNYGILVSIDTRQEYPFNMHVEGESYFSSSNKANVISKSPESLLKYIKKNFDVPLRAFNGGGVLIENISD